MKHDLLLMYNDPLSYFAFVVTTQLFGVLFGDHAIDVIPSLDVAMSTTPNFGFPDRNV